MSSQTLRQTIAAFWLGAYGVAAISQVPVPLPDGSASSMQAQAPKKSSSRKTDAQLAFDDGRLILEREHKNRLQESDLTYARVRAPADKSLKGAKRADRTVVKDMRPANPPVSAKPSASLPSKGLK